MDLSWGWNYKLKNWDDTASQDAYWESNLCLVRGKVKERGANVAQLNQAKMPGLEQHEIKSPEVMGLLMGKRHTYRNWRKLGHEPHTEERRESPVCSFWGPQALGLSPHRSVKGQLRKCGRKMPVVSMRLWGAEGGQWVPRKSCRQVEGRCRMDGRRAVTAYLTVANVAWDRRHFALFLRLFHWTEHLEIILIQWRFWRSVESHNKQNLLSC